MAERDQEPISLLILQPTPFCNIDCRYCYLPSRNEHRLMSQEVLVKIFDKVFGSGRIGPRITVVWHAGEPMMAPVSFYERALEIAAARIPAGTEIKHCIQTNGTLIDESWCEFFKRSGMSVGISIDGPRSLNDANRRTRSGEGTFDTVMRGIRLLHAHDIGFDVISVVGRDALCFPDELFEFYVANDISNLAFNIEEIEGANVSTSLGAADVDSLFRRFARRMFQLYQQSDRVTSLREYDDVVMRTVSGSVRSFPNTQATPFCIITVDHAGNFCTFSPELLGMEDDSYGDFVLGNLLRDALDTAAQSDKFKRLLAEIETGIEECRRDCEYFSMCGGGAPSNKLYENGSFATSESMYFRLTIKAITDEALQVYSEVLTATDEETEPGALSGSALEELIQAD